MNNQTIDGVPREAFKWALEQLEEDGNKGCGYFDSLRALLDAPAKSDYMQSCEAAHLGILKHCKPAAQHQGEPVALDERALYDAWRESNLGYVRPFNKYEWSAWQARARITEQPAPVTK